LRLVLASKSPSRLATLQAAGIEPEVLVSGADESSVDDDEPAARALGRARLKAEAVAGQLFAAGNARTPTAVLGCDSVFEFDGSAYGKPRTPEVATERIRRMRGRSGVLHTGHQLILSEDGHTVSYVAGDTAASTVWFADMDDAEIAAYVATGEPLQVAGSFTIDGLAGPFITRIEGDPHNVVGLSLPLLRNLIIAAGHSWPELWAR
jgi:septum formation protein